MAFEPFAPSIRCFPAFDLTFVWDCEEVLQHLVALVAGWLSVASLSNGEQSPSELDILKLDAQATRSGLIGESAQTFCVQGSVLRTYSQVIGSSSIPTPCLAGKDGATQYDKDLAGFHIPSALLQH